MSNLGTKARSSECIFGGVLGSVNVIVGTTGTEPTGAGWSNSSSRSGAGVLSSPVNNDECVEVGVSIIVGGWEGRIGGNNGALVIAIAFDATALVFTPSLTVNVTVRLLPALSDESE